MLKIIILQWRIFESKNDVLKGRSFRFICVVTYSI